MDATKSQPLALYHGTSGIAAASALAFGLQPRRRAVSNWTHTVDSNPDTVYLTDVYATYFAVHAVSQVEARTKAKTRAAILEIDNTDALRDKLVPDEDFLEQVSRGDNALNKSLGRIGMVRRTKYFRKKIRELRHLWAMSISSLGTVGHYGVIPPTAIRRVAYVDLEAMPWLVMYAGDATITLMNHKVCAWKYRNLTRWIFGEAITVKDWLGEPTYDVLTTSMPEQVRQVERLLSERQGIEVINLNHTKS